MANPGGIPARTNRLFGGGYIEDFFCCASICAALCTNRLFGGGYIEATQAENQFFRTLVPTASSEAATLKHPGELNVEFGEIVPTASSEAATLKPPL